ncbi:MAG: ribosome maturation factor RimP [Clostridia bacterium]|nr:ribosome maturation factor RimP [Clostridia bacterium]
MGKGDLALMVTPLCQRLADEMGYELVDVCLDKEPQGKYLRIYLDKEAGISLDDCEAYHRKVQPKLESYDYDFLEVSSPGVDRPLKTPRDFERCQGDEVEVRLYKPVEGQKIYQGILMGLQDKEVVILCGEAEKRFAQRTVALVKPIVDMTGVESVEFD